MHVGWFEVDPSWLLKVISTLFVVAVGILYFVKSVAGKYFEVDTSFGRSRRDKMPGPISDACVVCGKPGAKKCSGCKSVRYCSSKCQTEHWGSGHKLNCKQASKDVASPKVEFKASSTRGRKFSGIALVPVSGSFKSTKKPRDVLFPYDEFIKLYNWDLASFPPCGLLNCGNSCFANVVLQCLTYTKPLVSYLLVKGHRRECRRNDWCFLCVFQQHFERASQSSQAFSPLNILSRLPSFGGNFGFGKQEDAHEFMRIVVDTMQSVCLDEFGGEKALSPAAQETTLIQHIFGGQLQSQVICTKCCKVSNQLENLMDLTVEIHGEVESLEECLDQFTAKEWLDGENMYKCDGCKDYVKACKRLTIKRAPNILTIALKRFQSGRFGKLNKRVTFPELLNLSPYMSENGDGSDIYRLYAVVVHLDMLNASFFGHYICYTKDFHGNWYRVDDCKVARVEVDEVLSQGAYMLLYSRISARMPYTLRTKPPKEVQSISNGCSSCADETKNCGSSLDLLAGKISDSQGVECGDIKDAVFVVTPCDSEISNDIPNLENGFSSQANSEAARPPANVDASGSYSFPEVEASSCQNVAIHSSCNGSQNRDQGVMNMVRHDNGVAVLMEISEGEDDQSAKPTSNNKMEVPMDSGSVNIESFSSEATSMRPWLKRESPFLRLDVGDGTGAKRAELSNGYTDDD